MNNLHGPVDPAFVTFGRRTFRPVVKNYYDRYEGHWSEEVNESYPLERAELISSRRPHDGLHAPCIDVDVPARLIPSSTDGHSHLYIDKAMTWRQYRRILRALVAAGVVEKGYYVASRNRRATHLRLPWIKKDV